MPRQKAPEGETPQAKFERTAGGRVGNIVESLRTLGSQAGEVPSDEYIAEAFGAIRASVDKAEQAWRSRTSERRKSFEFKGPPVQQNAAPKATATAARR